jgi:hypothetical protein
MSPRRYRRAGEEKPCTWPHANWSLEKEWAMRAAIAPYESLIDRAATYLSAHQEPLADDLRQEAVIMLWRMGAKKITAAAERDVNRQIYKRMEKVLWRMAKRCPDAREAAEEIGLVA